MKKKTIIIALGAISLSIILGGIFWHLPKTKIPEKNKYGEKCMQECLKEKTQTLEKCAVKCGIVRKENENNLCGDGVCNNKELNNPNLCPEDCPNNPTNIFDLRYSTVDSGAVKLDLYFPEKTCTNKSPLVIMIHGGAFKSGDKQPMDTSFLTDNCYAVASLNYRLSGEAIFPAGNQDLKSAIRWLRANAKKYNLDPENFGVMGGSAGGYYSSFLGTTGDIKDFDIGDNLEYSSEVQAVVNQFGPVDFSTLAQNRADGGIPRSVVESEYLGCDIESIDCKNVIIASPINYVSKNDPPFFILHGALDTQIPIKQSQDFYAKLQEIGVLSTFTTLPNAGHGGLEFRDYKSQILSFFDKYLTSNPSITSDIPYYVLVQHYDPIGESGYDPITKKGNAKEFFETAKLQVKYATDRNIKLSIWLGISLTKYILDDPQRIDLVGKWIKDGHEIGIHHHSIYKPVSGWDGYTALGENEAIQIRKTYSKKEIVENYLGTQDDYMDVFHELESGLAKREINIEIKSGVNNEQFNKKTSMPDEIIYGTASGFINNGDPGRFLQADSDITKAVNEYITTGYVNGIKRKWLAHYTIGKKHLEEKAEMKFNELDSKTVFVGVNHNYHGENIEVDEQTWFRKFVDFLHEKDPSGEKSMTVSEVIESGILPEKEITFLCENNNGTLCGGIAKVPGNCNGNWLTTPEYPYNVYGDYSCCLGNCEW